MKTILRRTLTIMIFAAAVLLPLTEANAQTPKIRIEGAWDVILSDKDELFKLHYTFAAGKTVNEGTVIFSTEVDAGPGVICTPSLGAWKRISANQFLATSKTTCNEKGFVFTIKTFDSFTVNDANSAFTGTTTFVGFNQDNEVIFSEEADLHGTMLFVSPAPLFAQIPDATLIKKEAPRRYRKQ
jgi:hypothetical protein